MSTHDADDDDRRVYTWEGFTSARPVILKYPIPSVGIKTVSLGRSHGALLTVSGKLFMLGNNSDSQLGVNSDTATVSVPTLLSLPTGTKVVNIECYYCHTHCLHRYLFFPQ